MVTTVQTCIVELVMLLTMVTAEPYYPWPSVPKWTEKPHMARYLAHYANWGTVSAYSPEYKQPFGTIQSFSDGPLKNSTGVPYFYISSLSDTHKNIQYNDAATLTMSLAESDWCKTLAEDPEEPTCARLTLVGQIVKVDSKEELDFAKLSLFSRHPAMKDWPTGHDWQYYKMVIKAVHLLDYFGGASHVAVKDYFAASP